ncbi:MAG: sorbosone dehydrogenase family protein [Spirulina sp.]
MKPTSNENKRQIVARGLNFPTSLAVDDAGGLYVAESGLPFAGAPPGGRVHRVEPDGNLTCLRDNLRPPVNGLTYHQGGFYLSEGGYPGRISRLSLTGDWSVVVDNLPGQGNYHTNMVAVGPDGKLYFSQGAMTNSGIVGLDAYDLGWLKRLPHPCDIPGYEIELRGINVETENPLVGSDRKAEKPRIQTGAFSPFGTQTIPGQRISARVPCTAAILRCNPDGSDLELFAWGLRNAYGLGFLPDGRLLATDQGADDRGSRPIGNAPDLLFAVELGKWYGWPDFIGGIPVSDPVFQPQRGPAPEFLLGNHGELPTPEEPLLRFPVNAAAVKFAIVPPTVPSWSGHLFVALFGDEKPMTAPAGAKVGRSLVRIDPRGWSLHPLAIGSFSRPIDLCFHPGGEALYILDFGDFEMNAKGVVATAGSGTIQKISLEALRSS